MVLSMEQKKYLTIGNVLGETFNFYFSNFLLVCLPYVIVIFPYGQLYTAFHSLFGAGGTPWYITLLSSLISLALSYGVSFYLTISVLNRFENKKVHVKDAVAALLPRLFAYGFMSFMILFFSMLWSILLIFPGAIYFAARSIADVVMVREGLGIRASMKRSRVLTKKRRFAIFFCFALLFILMFALILVYYRLLGITFGGGLDQLTGIAGAIAQRPLISILYSLVSNCFMPLFVILSVVIYLNLLKEKEGFATEQLAEGFLEEEND